MNLGKIYRELIQAGSVCSFSLLISPSTNLCRVLSFSIYSLSIFSSLSLSIYLSIFREKKRMLRIQQKRKLVRE